MSQWKNKFWNLPAILSHFSILPLSYSRWATILLLQCTTSHTFLLLRSSTGVIWWPSAVEGTVLGCLEFLGLPHLRWVPSLNLRFLGWYFATGSHSRRSTFCIRWRISLLIRSSFTSFVPSFVYFILFDFLFVSQFSIILSIDGGCSVILPFLGYYTFHVRWIWWSRPFILQVDSFDRSFVYRSWWPPFWRCSHLVRCSGAGMVPRSSGAFYVLEPPENFWAFRLFVGRISLPFWPLPR